MSEILNINGKDFLVCDNVSIDSNNYLYVVAMDNSFDFTFLEVKEQDNKKSYQTVTDPKLVNNILQLLKSN